MSLTIHDGARTCGWGSLRTVALAWLLTGAGGSISINPLVAQQTPAPREPRNPVGNGLVLFAIAEGYTNQAPTKPSFALTLSTEREYSCVLPLGADIAVTDTSVSVLWVGIPSDVQICGQAVSPASGWFALAISTGTYALRLMSRDTTDTYRLIVTEDAIEIEGAGRVTRQVHRKYWRYPVGTLAIYCGSRSTHPTMCPSLYEWLAGQSILAEFQFPAGGRIPYPGHNNIYQINAGPRFYRVAGASAEQRLVRDISAWQKEGGWTQSGDAVIVRSRIGEVPVPP